MVQQISRGDLEQIDLEQKEIDRFMNLIDLMKRSPQISNSYSGPKKQLTMRFTLDGAHKNTEIVLDPEAMPIIFGNSNNQEVGQKADFVQLKGTKICNQHF